jgi:hypothetical protein
MPARLSRTVTEWGFMPRISAISDMVRPFMFYISAVTRKS